MIEKDEQGKVVEYEYEPEKIRSDGDRSGGEAASPDGDAVDATKPDGIASATTADEIDAAREIVAKQVRADLDAAHARDLEELAKSVAVLNQVVQEERRLARDRRTTAVMEADRARKVAVLAAHEICSRKIAESSRRFCEKMKPLNDRVAELAIAHEAALAAALAALEDRSAKRRLALAEAEVAETKSERNLQGETAPSQAGGPVVEG
jgi:hypothetical protein